MKPPKPGQRARGTRTGRPIMVLLDLMGRRMALRILWELSRSPQPLTFRALQVAADTNPALLNTRLKELRGALLVTHNGEGYALSVHGVTVVKLIVPLVGWAETWAATVEAQAATITAGGRKRESEERQRTSLADDSARQFEHPHWVRTSPQSDLERMCTRRTYNGNNWPSVNLRTKTVLEAKRTLRTVLRRRAIVAVHSVLRRSLDLNATRLLRTGTMSARGQLRGSATR